MNFPIHNSKSAPPAAKAILSGAAANFGFVPWGVGGQLVTDNDLRALARQKLG